MSDWREDLDDYTEANGAAELPVQSVRLAKIHIRAAESRIAQLEAERDAITAELTACEQRKQEYLEVIDRQMAHRDRLEAALFARNREEGR